MLTPVFAFGSKIYHQDHGLPEHSEHFTRPEHDAYQHTLPHHSAYPMVYYPLRNNSQSVQAQTPPPASVNPAPAKVRIQASNPFAK